MPKPDRDTGLLVDALARRDVTAQVVAWDAPFDWSSCRLALIRSPWNYWRHLGAFLEWGEAVSQVTRLLNPLSVIQWNCEKTYLFELQNAGLPILPTVHFRAGEPPSVDRLFANEFSGELVIKPTIGAGSNGALRARKDDLAFLPHLEVLLSRSDALAQPYVPDVSANGEMSLIYFEGKYSHAIRKRPAEGDFRVQDQYGGTLHEHTPSPREMEIAEAAIAAVPETTLYGRVDLVYFEGQPAIMELEVIEPELFLRKSEKGVERFASALQSHLAQ